MLDELDEMRRHLRAVLRDHLAHALEVPTHRDDSPKRREWIGPIGIRQFEGATEVFLEHLHRFIDYLPNSRIDRGISPVRAISDAQPLEVAVQTAHPVEIGLWKRMAIA